MRLKSFGCSFIFGSELADDGSNGPHDTPSQLTWPAHLARHLSRDYVCYARPGSGNLQILENILNQAATSDAADLFVIGWTWIDRFDYYPANPASPSRSPWRTIMPVDTDDLAKVYYNLYGLKTISLRYFNVYGERQPLKGQYAPVIGLFLKQKQENKSLTIVGDGTQRRDFTHVQDVVQANLAAGISFLYDELGFKDEDVFGQVYNIGCSKNYSILEIASMISEDISFIPARPGEAQETLSDTNKFRNIFKWSPNIQLNKWIRDFKNENNL